jgi:hypothetical protein
MRGVDGGLDLLHQIRESFITSLLDDNWIEANQRYSYLIFDGLLCQTTKGRVSEAFQ